MGLLITERKRKANFLEGFTIFEAYFIILLMLVTRKLVGVLATEETLKSCLRFLFLLRYGHKTLDRTLLRYNNKPANGLF